MDRDTIIQEIIKHEWNQFDKVNNAGGRASCQDDWKTFRIMRLAQYINWPDDVLSSYYEDLLLAEREERNLIAEKYGRMMESTAPDEYINIRHLFPVRSTERTQKQEEIIAIEMAMDEEFCREYPAYASGGRVSRSSDDTEYSTSKETYIRGEMGTWSDRTFDLYASWVRDLAENGHNLPVMTANNIAKEYGCRDLNELESIIESHTNTK